MPYNLAGGLGYGGQHVIYACAIGSPVALVLYFIAKPIIVSTSLLN